MKGLDNYCLSILTILYLEEKPLGFNELFERVSKLFGFSKPTLSMHLKHLLKENLVIKETETDSSLKLKPTRYGLNWNIVNRYVPTVSYPVKKWEELCSKKDFKTLAWHLYDDFTVYCLLTLRYHLEALLERKDADKGLLLSQISLSTFIESLYLKIRTMLKKAKKEEIAELLKEWDAIVENYAKKYLSNLASSNIS